MRFSTYFHLRTQLTALKYTVDQAYLGCSTACVRLRATNADGELKLPTIVNRHL